MKYVVKVNRSTYTCIHVLAMLPWESNTALQSQWWQQRISQRQCWLWQQWEGQPFLGARLTICNTTSGSSTTIRSNTSATHEKIMCRAFPVADSSFMLANVCKWVCVYVCVCVCTHVHVCVCICVCVCVCVVKSNQSSHNCLYWGIE